MMNILNTSRIIHSPQLGIRQIKLGTRRNATKIEVISMGHACDQVCIWKMCLRTRFRDVICQVDRIGVRHVQANQLLLRTTF
ncbi:unnamed protein product [Dicrocoelium dendriticum]|nr:unnamed protein product [Dicrocoelium dendriticum]